MSQVYAVPVTFISILISVLIASHVDLPDGIAGPGGIAVGLAIGVAWTVSDRFPDGSGPM